MKITDSYENISIVQIDLFEETYQVRIPQVYKDFLLRQNGGESKPDMFNYWVEYIGKSGNGIRRFLGIHESEFYSLNYWFRTEKVWMIRDYFPIAHCGNGDDLVICVKGKNENKIFIWRHEFHAKDNPVFVAESLESFLNSLHEYIDGEEQ